MIMIIIIIVFNIITITILFVDVVFVITDIKVINTDVIFIIIITIFVIQWERERINDRKICLKVNIAKIEIDRYVDWMNRLERKI